MTRPQITTTAQALQVTTGNAVAAAKSYRKFGLERKATVRKTLIVATRSSSRTFETFPFPWPPGKEPNNDPRVEAIALAANELVEKRDAWLNPPGASAAELTELSQLRG